MKKILLLCFFASTLSVIASDDTPDKCPDCRITFCNDAPYESKLCPKHLWKYEEQRYANDRPADCTCKRYYPGMFDLACTYHLKLHQQGKPDSYQIKMSTRRINQDDCNCM